MKHKKYFTFPELLACLFCTVLFSSVAFLTLAEAASNARETACSSKLRKIGEAALSYADDFGDYTVPHISGKLRGWPRVLSAYDAKLTPDAYRCPEDNIKRNFDAPPISFSLNAGHLWNVRQSNTNRKEWGTASVLTGSSVLLSGAPEPSETAWIFEYWNPNNNYRQLWERNDRALFTLYTMEGFHDNRSLDTVLFLDGHVTGVEKAFWKRSDNRGILFKDLHTPETCTPNLR